MLYTYNGETANNTIIRTHEYFLLPEFDRKVQARYKMRNLPSVKDLEQKTLIMLINTDNAVDYPEPLQPNMIQVGGLQIAEARALPMVCMFINLIIIIKSNFSRKWKNSSAAPKREQF